MRSALGLRTQGGANCAPLGCGTALSLTATGAFTTLYSFCSLSGCTDGEYPSGVPIQATDGNIYGTTTGGGSMGTSSTPCSILGCGTIFKLTPGGALATIHTFTGSGGSSPFGLVQDTNGDIYGAEGNGGAHGWEGGYNFGYGTVFSLSLGLGPFVEGRPASGKTGTTVEILGTVLTGATGVTFDDVEAAFTV
jgi:hypothetical protein